MELKDFVKEVAKEVERATALKVIPKDELKNNGMKYHGIMFCCEENSNMNVVLYLDFYYEQFEKNGLKWEYIIQAVIKSYEDNRIKRDINLEFFSQYETTKDKIMYKLINYQSNIELLKGKPHVNFLDLVLVFYVDLENEEGSMTIGITNKHLEYWNVTLKEVYEMAIGNTEIRLPAVVQNMFALMAELHIPMKIRELLGDEACEEICKQFGDESPMYVSSNEKRLNGAATLYYGNHIKDQADKLNSDLIIIPSSIHELIFIPAKDKANAWEVREMVKEINAQQVAEDEVLSNNVYWYSRENDSITIIAE